MEGFNLIDAIAAAVIILSAVLAYSRGLVRETMAILGWVGAAILGFIFAPSVEPLIKEVPILNKFLADNCELSMVAAFAATFALGLVIVSLFTPLFAALVQKSVLAGLDQGLGFLFGVARGLLLVAVGFLVYHQAMATNSLPMVDASRSDKIFASLELQLKDVVPTDVPTWIVERYKELTATCPTVVDAAGTAAVSKPAAPAAGTTATAPATSATPTGPGKTIILGPGTITATPSN